MKWDHGFYRVSYKVYSSSTSRTMFIVTDKRDTQLALDIFYRRANSSMELFDLENLGMRYDQLEIKYPLTFKDKVISIEEDLVKKFSEITGYNVMISNHYDNSLDTRVLVLDTNTYVDSWTPEHVRQLIEFLNSCKIKHFEITPIPQQKFN